MSIEIRLLKDDAELNALFEFRYQIYVEEMARPQRYADHKTRRIEDPLDEMGYNLAAFSDGRIVGGVRVNLGKDGGLDYYRSLLRMDEFAELWPFRVSLCTRMMTYPEYRGTTLSYSLSKACYDIGLTNNIIVNYIDCNDHLVEFFTKMGYEWAGKATHHEYGLVNVMRFWLEQEARPPIASRFFA